MLKNTKDLLISMLWKADSGAALSIRDDMLMHRYHIFRLGKDGIIYPGEGKEIFRNELLIFLELLDQEEVRIMWVGAPEIPADISVNGKYISLTVRPRPYRY